MRAAALGSAVRLVRSLLRLAGGAFLAHAVAGLSWPLALIFGAIALATGPTVVSPLVQRMRLPAFLSLVLARLIQPGAGEEPVTSASPVTLQLTLGTLFLLFSGCEVLLPEAGLPASVAAGVVVGLRLDGAASKLDALIFRLAQLAITVLFALLAADVAWSELSPLGLGGLICVLGLMPFRLVVVQLAGLGLPLDAREKLLISWVAPRGIVTVAVASLIALQLEQAGYSGAGALKGLVFLTILVMVGLQGLTAPWLAGRLGLSEEAFPPGTRGRRGGLGPARPAWPVERWERGRALRPCRRRMHRQPGGSRTLP